MQFTKITSPQWADQDHTAINCTVTFSDLGEVPYTASPTDPIAHSREIFLLASQGQYGAVAPYVASAGPSNEQIIAAFTAAIQLRLDTFARTRSYDSILSACTYVTSSVPRFAAEAAYCVSARDATWATGYQLLADVQAGNRAMPTVADVMTELPALEWPL